MPRRQSPWFYRQTGWWMVWLAGKKARLAKRRANQREAEQRLLERLLERAKNPVPDV